VVESDVGFKSSVHAGVPPIGSWLDSPTYQLAIVPRYE
jgi:hypothetical protein